MVALADEHGEEGLKTWTSGRSCPDPPPLGSDIAVDMIGRNRVDGSGQNARPEGLPIGRLPEWRVDLAGLAATPADVVSQVMWAGLEMNDSTSRALAKASRKSFGRRDMDGIQRSADSVRYVSSPLHG